jgi:hypothetical protein
VADWGFFDEVADDLVSIHHLKVVFLPIGKQCLVEQGACKQRICLSMLHTYMQGPAVNVNNIADM